MKLTRIITLCAITATLALSLGDALAQQDNGGGNGNGGNRNGGGGNRKGGNQGRPSQGSNPAIPRAEASPGEPNSIGTVSFLQRGGNRTPR